MGKKTARSAQKTVGNPRRGFPLLGVRKSGGGQPLFLAKQMGRPTTRHFRSHQMRRNPTARLPYLVFSALALGAGAGAY